jgi:hypothetical protein
MTSRSDAVAANEEPGGRLIQATWIATAVFAIVQVLAAALPRKPVLALSIAVSVTLFVVGCVAFLAAYAIAVSRSRDEVVTLPGVFLLADAPAHVRRSFFAAFGVEVVVAFAAAGVRPFTPLAFGILAPMLGLGMGGLWAARHGSFEPIVVGDSSRQRKRTSQATRPAPSPARRRRWYEPVDLDDEPPSSRPRRRS